MQIHLMQTIQRYGCRGTHACFFRQFEDNFEVKNTPRPCTVAQLEEWGKKSKPNEKE